VLPGRTDIAGFVGIAERGPANVPSRITSWSQFVTTFGRHQPNAWLAYAVEGFFANGGDRCWIVRVLDPERAARASALARDRLGRVALRVEAANEGRWGDQLGVTLEPRGHGRFTLVVRERDAVRERWPTLELDRDSPRRVDKIVNDPVAGSTLITVDVIDELADPRGVVLQLAGGRDGLDTLRPEHLTGGQRTSDEAVGLAALATVDEIAVLAIPDILSHDGPPPPVRRPSAAPCDDPGYDPCLPTPSPTPTIERPPRFSEDQIGRLQDALIAQCDGLRDRFAVLDPPASCRTLDRLISWRQQVGDSSFAALYYPWIIVADPTRGSGAVVPMPPRGHVSGVFARNDLTMGVHKAPANSTVVAARDLADHVDDVAHGEANDASVNIIRRAGGRGIRVAGARSLDRDLSWRYINVRRLMSMIEESISSRLRWLVWEPNSGEIWREVDREVRLFLDGLWRKGMLDGGQAADAYSVQCDETTSTADDVSNGRLICYIGVQPPLPAEFVTVRIAVTEAGVQILGEQGRQVLTTAGALRG
jgi:hypothetical protein